MNTGEHAGLSYSQHYWEPCSNTYHLTRRAPVQFVHVDLNSCTKASTASIELFSFLSFFLDLGYNSIILDALQLTGYFKGFDKFLHSLITDILHMDPCHKLFS